MGSCVLRVVTHNPHSPWSGRQRRGPDLPPSVHSLPWYSMWSSTEEEGLPFTVMKLQGCLKKKKNQKVRFFTHWSLHLGGQNEDRVP